MLTQTKVCGISEMATPPARDGLRDCHFVAVIRRWRIRTRLVCLLEHAQTKQKIQFTLQRQAEFSAVEITAYFHRSRSVNLACKLPDIREFASSAPSRAEWRPP